MMIRSSLFSNHGYQGDAVFLKDRGETHQQGDTDEKHISALTVQEEPPSPREQSTTGQGRVMWGSMVLKVRG